MTDLEKRFLKNTDDTGRFIYQSLVTGVSPLSVIEERDKRYEQMAKK